MQVFAVMCGEYSDYSCCGIFSTKEKAQEYIDRMEFCSSYEEYYNIHEWNVDKVSKEIPTNDLCLFNGKVVRLDDLSKEFGNEGYVAYCLFSDLLENAKSRVLEIIKEYYLNGLLNNNFTITDKRYVEYENDTGFHHYNIDVAKYYEMEEI